MTESHNHKVHPWILFSPHLNLGSDWLTEGQAQLMAKFLRRSLTGFNRLPLWVWARPIKWLTRHPGRLGDGSWDLGQGRFGRTGQIMAVRTSLFPTVQESRSVDPRKGWTVNQSMSIMAARGREAGPNLRASITRVSEK